MVSSFCAACTAAHAGFLQDYITQILSVLDALHTADLIHRGLNLRCVGLVSGRPGESKRVKIFKTGYFVQLLNMNRSEPFCLAVKDDDIHVPENW